MKEPQIDMPPEGEKLIDDWVEANDETSQVDKALIKRLLNLCTRMGAERIIWTRCTAILKGFHEMWEQNREAWIEQCAREGRDPSQVFAETVVKGIERIMREVFTDE